MRRFQFVITMRGAATSVRLVEVRTEPRARELAQRILHESPEHLGVDVWEGEHRLFTVGQSTDSAA
ncbi:MAG TPA: hypothetical protein VGG29_14725 [Caulobacteraceae bacterium]